MKRELPWDEFKHAMKFKCEMNESENMQCDEQTEDEMRMR